MSIPNCLHHWQNVNEASMKTLRTFATLVALPAMTNPTDCKYPELEQLHHTTVHNKNNNIRS